MKKLTIWMMVSSWILYLFVPIVYKLMFGRYPRNIQSMGYVPESYMTKAAIIISVFFAMCILLIYLLPVKEKTMVGKVTCGSGYYYITIAVYAILAINAGVLNFSNAVTGGANSSLFSYYSMFFYPQVLFLIFLFCVKDNGGLMLLVASYLALTLISSSRSGAVNLGIYLIGFSIVSGFFSSKKIKIETDIKKYKKKIRMIVIALAIVSPIIFVYTTQLRGSTTSNGTNRSIETIAARCSCLDEAGLVLYLNDTNDLDKDLFIEKYGLLNQIKCIIDSTIPGAVFEDDVNPNQYYRAVVGYMSVEDAKTYYSSVNLMLPVYMVMKYGLLGGMLFSTMLIVIFYMVVSKMKNSVWQVVLISIVFVEMIYFFDWVMVWKAFFRAALTIVMFELIARHVHFRLRRVRFKVLNH